LRLTRRDLRRERPVGLSRTNSVGCVPMVTAPPSLGYLTTAVPRPGGLRRAKQGAFLTHIWLPPAGTFPDGLATAMTPISGLGQGPMPEERKFEI